MFRLETIAEVGPEREVTIRVPADLAVGAHRKLVLIDEPSVAVTSGADPSAACLKRRNGILVYTGQLLDDPNRVLEEMRLERERRFLSGSRDESD